MEKAKAEHERAGRLARQEELLGRPVTRAQSKKAEPPQPKPTESPLSAKLGALDWD